MALTPDGALGGLAVVEESTYGTTPASPTWIWQHYVDSTVVPQRTVIKPSWATFQPNTVREYSVAWCEGEIKVAMSNEQDIVGTLLSLGSTFSSNVYTFGDGSEPDATSISLLQNYGGGDASVQANYHEWIFSGVKPTGYRFEFVQDSNVIMTVPVIGQTTTKTSAGSAQTPAPPSESYILMPSDIGTVTYGASSTEITIQGATISVDLPKTGSERRGLGQTTIREPVTNGQPAITFNISVDLDASTGNDTIAILDEFVSGNVLGDITIGDYALTSCMLEGDPPSLSAGLMTWAMTGQATQLDITTQDTIA